MSTTISRPKATAPASRARGRRRRTYVKPTVREARTYEVSRLELVVGGAAIYVASLASVGCVFFLR